MNQSEETEKQSTIRVLLVPPGDYPREVEISTDLKSLQNAVCGDIEATYPFEDPVAIILNENGKLNGMPLNRVLYDDFGRTNDILTGPFLVVGLGEENFCSLTNEQMEKYEQKFHRPEAFMKLGRSIMVMQMTDAQVERQRSAPPPERTGRNDRER